MKRVIFGIFIGTLSLILFIGPIWGSNSKFIPPPYDEIKDIEVFEFESTECMSYEEYLKRDYDVQKKYSGMWSTIWQKNLSYFKISVEASSTLKGYSINSLCDKKVETAWVEGAKGDGLKEWVSIKLDADKHSPSSTPFTIDEISIIPGYAKSQKTWEENNRVKKALLIIHSPKAPESEYIACRLKFEDVKKLQVFRIPDDLIVSNQDPMTKILWLIIEDVYKGTKYSDTCISEVVVRGGCLP